MRLPCRACQDAAPLPFAFTMAFQPIMDVVRSQVWGYEALVRGPAGEGAGTVLSQVTEESLYKFDQAARVRAIKLAGALFPLGGNAVLSINFMPNAVYEPSACIRASIEAAQQAGFPHDRLMFEFTENEKFADPSHVQRIVAEYRRRGLITALDDFGAGHSGLNLLADLHTDLIKVDMALIRGIDTDRRRQAVVAAIVQMATAIGVQVIAEGLETAAEVATVREMGVSLLQGYFFARPAVERLPLVQIAGPVEAPARSDQVQHVWEDFVAAVP